MLPTTFRELATLLNGGSSFELQCLKKIEELEGYLDEHSRLTAVKASIDRDEVVRLSVDYSKYEDYNLAFEQRNYYDNSGTPCLTAREANQYEAQENLYLMANDNPNEYFVAVKGAGQEWRDRYLSQRLESETYTEFLERKLEEAEASDEESLGMYRRRRDSSEETQRQLQEAQSEGLEQARLLGMSGEREASLLGKLEQEKRKLEQALNALSRIAAIENELVGPDWEEIDQARTIARDALSRV